MTNNRSINKSSNFSTNIPGNITSSAEKFPFYEVVSPFEVVYRNSSTKTPVSPHTHNGLEIYFTLSDLPNAFINNTALSLKAGSIIAIPPNTVHQLYNQPSTVYERYIVTIKNSWLNNLFEDTQIPFDKQRKTGMPIIAKLSKKDISLLKDKFDLLLKHESLKSLSAYSDFFSLLDLIDELLRKGLKENNDDSLSISKPQENINRIITYIDSNIDSPLSIEDISEHFHMNKDYLSRQFKAYTHTTIGNYIAFKRTIKAKALLNEGLSVSEVAERLGFSSYSYFFKFFKKMTGISPSHYRSAN